MAFPTSLFLVILFSFLSLLLPSTQSLLSTHYYNKTCPQFHNIMQRIIADKQISFPITAAAVLRVYFHGCIVNGCDASILIASNAFNKSELDAESNLSLAGDAFDLITRAKTALELECPAVVSCSDILAISARDLVIMAGGPFYEVLMGRKDSKVSDPFIVESNLPKTTMSTSKLLSLLYQRFSAEEMVALLGVHTIGFSHCKEFANRIFNFSKTSDYDPAYNPAFAQGLRKLCANYTENSEMSTFNDVFTPGKFDNMYYKNLQRGLGCYYLIRQCSWITGPGHLWTCLLQTRRLFLTRLLVRWRS